MRPSPSTFLASALALALAAAPAGATSTIDYLGFANGAGARGVSQMFDMEGGRWQVEVSPGWFSGDFKEEGGTGGDDTIAAKGFMLSAAVKRELSERWGVGVVASMVRQAGEDTLSAFYTLRPQSAQTGTPGGAGFAGGKYKDSGSSFVALALTRQFFAGRKVRMPLSFGPALANERFKFEHSFVNPNNSLAQTETIDFSRNYLALFANLALDIPVGEKFRVMPGALVILGMDGNLTQAKYDYVVNQAGSVAKYPATVPTAGGGGDFYLGVRYLPWNLSAYTSLPVFPEASDVKTLTLKWSRRW